MGRKIAKESKLRGSGPELELKTNFSLNCYQLIPTDYSAAINSLYFSFSDIFTTELFQFTLSIYQFDIFDYLNSFTLNYLRPYLKSNH